MEKLKIYYLEKQEKSSLGFEFKTNTPKLYIGTKETRLIEELKQEFEKDLRIRQKLEENEYLELEEFDDALMRGERENGRINKDIYRVLNNMNKQVNSGITTWYEICEELIQQREADVEKCI